ARLPRPARPRPRGRLFAHKPRRPDTASRDLLATEGKRGRPGIPWSASWRMTRSHSGEETVRRGCGGRQCERKLFFVAGRDREPAPYVFGHSQVELRRLAYQAALIEPVTRLLLVEAGVTSGMRVLDVGTGRGDVAILVAELVGETGSVVGVDR